MNEIMLDELLTKIEKQANDIECLCLLCTTAILEKSCEDKVFNGVMNILYSNIKSLNDKIADLKNLYMIDKN